SATVKGRSQCQLDFLVPWRRVADGRVERPIACWIVAHEQIRQNRVTPIARGNSKGQEVGNLFDLFGRGEKMDSVLVIQDDSLEDLKRHSKGAPRIVLQARDKGAGVEPESLSRCVFFPYVVSFL